jgi:hypothetical protein
MYSLSNRIACTEKSTRQGTPFEYTLQSGQKDIILRFRREGLSGELNITKYNQSGGTANEVHVFCSAHHPGNA